MAGVADSFDAVRKDMAEVETTAVLLILGSS
jgi:hypothetical protein